MDKTGDPPLVYYTTNCLIKASKVKKLNLRFDPEYGLSGGSDSVFFELLSRIQIQICCLQGGNYI